MAKDFIHLHVHSQYSIYKGLGCIRDLVNKAINDGMPGMALTDYGNMFGIKEFYDYVTRVNKKRKENGEEPFKPIFGCEMCVEPNYHIIVLAKNLEGYHNLITRTHKELDLLRQDAVEKFFEEEKDDLINIITCFFFRTGKLYEYILIEHCHTCYQLFSQTMKVHRRILNSALQLSLQ